MKTDTAENIGPPAAAFGRWFSNPAEAGRVVEVGRRLRSIVRRSFEFFVGYVVLLPLTVIGLLIVVLIWLARNPFVRRRAYRRYRALAHRLGIDRGTVVRFRFFGGEMVTSQLDIMSLWPGSPREVLAAVIASVTAEGYVPLQRIPPVPSGIRWAFSAPAGEGLPGLDVQVYRPGETIAGTDQVVPAATTGLRFGLV
jgi:hypothetical protein